MLDVTVEKDFRNTTQATLPLWKTGAKGESMMRAQITFFLPNKMHAAFTDKDGSELLKDNGRPKIHRICAKVNRKMQDFKILCSRITANNSRRNLFW